MSTAITGKKSSAGSLESNDVFIVLEERIEGTHIDVQSIVLAQFGDQIEASVREMLDLFHVDKVLVRVQDKGAYDCTLRARLETALMRYKESGHAQA